MSQKRIFAIIGGSGVYKIDDEMVSQEVDTPFGSVIVHTFFVNQEKCYFVPRHGSSHNITPSAINYRANIYALKKLNVTHIIATNAVGSVDKKIAISDRLLPDQFLDFTKTRPSTFFDGAFEVDFPNCKKSGVIHTDVTHPFSEELRKWLMKESLKFENKTHYGGTIAVFEGPRFETPAEIKMIKILGADIAGMTSVPECTMSKELEMEYAALCLITNLAAGMQEEVNHEEVAKSFSKNIETILTIIKRTISNNL
jgi:5'-methylthioadenosine phosphorylase